MKIPYVLTTHPYGLVAQFLHWTTVIFVAVAFIVSVGGPERRIYAEANHLNLGLHEALGVSVFLITLVRLGWRLVDSPPPSVPMPLWMERSSTLVHWLLYGLLLLVPTTAVLGAWFEGHPLILLGIGSIDPVIATSGPLGETLSDLHGLLGDVLVWIAGLHGAAALFHHYWLRDDVLKAMLPWTVRR